jgi:uncharacterized protein YaaW (UPF0174 family)
MVNFGHGVCVCVYGNDFNLKIGIKMAKKKEALGFVLIRLPSDVHKNLKVLCAQKELTMQHVINNLVLNFVKEGLPEIQGSH